MPPSTPSSRAPPKTATACSARRSAKIVGTDRRRLFPQGDRCRARQARRPCRAWSPITRAGDDWAEAEALALKRLFGVARSDGRRADGSSLPTCSSDATIDAAIAALAASRIRGSRTRRLRRLLREAGRARGESRMAALMPMFLTTEEGTPRAQTFAARRCRWRRLGSDAMLRPRAGRVRHAQRPAGAFARGRGERRGAARSPTRSRPTMSGASGRKPCSTMTTSSSRRRPCCRAPARPPGCCTRSTAASTTSWSTRRRTPTPRNGAIIERLAEEFFAGAGAATGLRTLFAVGDEKQSIYSFQGADPGAVRRSRPRFRGNAPRRSGCVWHEVPLTLSFRSTEPMLEAVDARVRRAAGRRRADLAGAARSSSTTPSAPAQAGLVELWEVEAEEKTEQADAFEPWNEEPAARARSMQLCKRIAATIKGWLDTASSLPPKAATVKAGDILILVRRARSVHHADDPRAEARAACRSPAPTACSSPTSSRCRTWWRSADVLLMPEDDLALAVVLKSPLFGFDDDDLFELAMSATARCGRRCKPRPRTMPASPRPPRRCRRWLSRADRRCRLTNSSPSCSAPTGSACARRMLTRLGPEAAEAIDEFLDLALAYDREAAPSLQGFVNQLRAGDVEIKRDMEQERDEVRIMTVHGAKGLQAPIVFLPDTCMAPRPQGTRALSAAARRRAAGRGRPSGLAAERTVDARRHRSQQAKAVAAQGRARGISPAALCRP